MIDLWITVNSPGEVSGWLKPVLREIKKQNLPWRVIVTLPPCRFSSGKEAEVCRKLPGVARVLDTRALLAFLFLGKLPADFVRQDQARVLFLGGDLFYAVWLKFRLGARALAYTDGRRQWVRAFNAFVTREDIGDLRVDAVDTDTPSDFDVKRLRLDPGKRRLLFLPGSRKEHVQKLFPFYIHVVDQLEDMFESWEMVVNFSPFVDAEYYIGKLRAKRAYIPGNLLQEDSQLVMKVCDLICCLPGTNTFEAAVLGKPMVVLLPSNWPDIIQLDGLLGILCNIPFLGWGLRQLLLPLMVRFVRFAALPNLFAKQLLVPEIKGFLRVGQVAQSLKNYMQNEAWRQQVGADLRVRFGQPGAAGRLIQLLVQL